MAGEKAVSTPMDHYQRLMLYMTARALSILLAHHNLEHDHADNEIINEAFRLAFGELPKEEKGSRAKGGHARAASLSKERRVEIARKAAEARWRKTDEPTT